MSGVALIINGRKVAREATFPVYNPATGDLVAECAQGDVDTLDRAVAAAKAAFPVWSATPDEERVAALHKIADLI